MFRIDLSSKRARLSLRFFTYGVMTVATIVLTSLAVLHVMGYRFNRSLLTFEQGGLVQFRSQPNNARVVLDGKIQPFTTPGRANLPAGMHDVEMRLDGYRAWQKSVQVAPGQLLWLNYVRFIPETVQTAPLRTFDTLVRVVASPDKRWLLLQEQAAMPQFVIADAGNPQEPVYTTITLPDAQLTKRDGKLGQFAVAEWDLSSRYILIRHINGDTREFIRVDRTGREDAVNVSQLFGLHIIDAHFSGSNPNILYARTDDVLRRLDISSRSASAALVTGLTQFSVYGDDTIAFTALRQDDRTAEQVLGIYHGHAQTIARAAPADAQVRFAYGEYFRHTYLAFTMGDGIMHILRDPMTASASDAAEFASYDLGFKASWLRLSDNGRMVIAGHQNAFQTYDLELDRTYVGTVPGATTDDRSPAWLDDYYLWTDGADTLRIFEFDGTNNQQITAVAPGFSVSLSQNGQALFSIGKNADGQYVLQRSDLQTD